MAIGEAQPLPLLIFPEPTPVDYQRGQSFRPPVHFPDHARQGQRVHARLSQLQQAFDEQRLELRANAQNDDPDLVVVFETVGSVKDFITATQRIQGLEWLAAMDDNDIVPDEDFYNTEDEARPLIGKVFLVGSNRAALDEVVRLWEIYRADSGADLGQGLNAWKSAFAHLKDVRFWGPEDRLNAELRDAWRFRIEHGDALLRFEIEAWHFSSQAKNSATSDEVRALVAGIGGRVLHEGLVAEIAYHAFLVEVPAAGVARLLAGADAPLLRSDRVMYFRAHGQAVAPGADATERVPGPAPSDHRTEGTPVVALLDGLPIANHPLLQGRLVVDDPDGWADDYPSGERMHGTAMASLIALGDLDAGEKPLDRPIYVRAVMRPAGADDPREERTPDDRLLIDLIHSAVRRIFEPIADRPAAAPSVRVINLSLGDRHRPFAGELSPWARLLDWLQHKYKVLIVVSSGNQPDDLLLDTAPGTLAALSEAQRSALAVRALHSDDMQRRILAPAESINALTVGACHADASTFVAAGGRIALFAEGGIAPYSGVGPGFRRGVKPDILLPGGRVLYREALVQAVAGRTSVQSMNTPQPPGHRVAAPPTGNGISAYTRGTSNAAALGTRWAARAYGVIDALRAGHLQLEPRYDSVLLKALLAHGARPGMVEAQVAEASSEVNQWHARRRLVSRYAGYGIADVERALTCTAQRATLLGVGELRNQRALEFHVPIPPALHAIVVLRRITATLAWMTPVNPRHSKYRVARLWIDLPDDPLQVQRAEGEWRQLRQGTVHHEVFEGDRAVAVNDGQVLRFRVNCMADASRIDAPVEFALCVSLEVAEGVALPIYEQVRERVMPRVGVRI